MDHFKKLIFNIKSNDKKFIVEKNAFERLMGMIPSGQNLSALTDVGLLVKDSFLKWPSFAKVLFCNVDYDILIMNIMLFNMFDVAIENSIIAIFLVYFIEKGLKMCKAYFGERNIINKTLIDESFLI